MMLSNPANAHPTADDESVSEADEPPDDRRVTPELMADNSNRNGLPKGQQAMPDAKKESLLTRALLRIHDFSSAEQTRVLLPSTRANMHDRGKRNNGISSTEVFSDDGTTTPLRSHAPSLPHPTTGARLPSTGTREKSQPKPITVSDEKAESELEANLRRKRCIRFACGRSVGREDDSKAMSDTVKDAKEEPPSAKRKPALTFVCPAPTSQTSASDDKGTVEQTNDRKPSTTTSAAPDNTPTESSTVPKPAPEAVAPFHPTPAVAKTPSKSVPVAVGGLGDFQPSDVTRFHEFGSSVEEEEDWVNEATLDKPKITLSDCMKKENAIRKLGEEVEAEAKQDEEGEADEEDDDDDDDAEDDEDNDDGNGEDGDPFFEDDYDELQTVHGDLSDDGNESDNEAGFASDDESDDGSEHSFWTPAMATAATSLDQATPFHPSLRPSPNRRSSVSSSEFEDNDNTPLARRKRSVVSSSANPAKLRPGTPSLPDSTDFVCGTLDEDRPLEAAYKSCIEERRRSKYVTLPQDIDPSFPTSDLEDNGDDDDDNDGGGLANNVTIGSPSDRMDESHNALEGRGRRKAGSSRTSPNQSPGNRQPSPHRKVHGRSPRRLRSPAPAPRRKSPLPHRRPSLAHSERHHPGINITGLAQRHTRIRTGSLPRTPNPFFARQEHTHRSSKTSAPRPAAHDVHTRGAVDIVAGLEKKRQKRKEKFWRQHCRKAAKEQQERKPLPGRGAERMKELGLEVAERFRAYGLGHDAPLVLSI